MKVLYGLLFIFLVGLVSAGIDGTIGLDLGYDGDTVYSGGNYTINVNYSTTSGNANLFDGYSIATLYTYYKGLLDTAYNLVYCKLDGCNMTGNINMNGNDILAVDDLTADTVISDNLIGESNSTYGTYINSTDIVWGYIGGL